MEMKELNAPAFEKREFFYLKEFPQTNSSAHEKLIDILAEEKPARSGVKEQSLQQTKTSHKKIVDIAEKEGTDILLPADLIVGNNLHSKQSQEKRKRATRILSGVKEQSLQKAKLAHEKLVDMAVKGKRVTSGVKEQSLQKAKTLFESKKDGKRKLVQLAIGGVLATNALAGTDAFMHEQAKTENVVAQAGQPQAEQANAQPKAKQETKMLKALAKKADKESGTNREKLKKNIKLIVDSLQERKIATPRVIAYAMATIETETAHTYKPVREAYYLDKAYNAKPGTYGEQSAINNGYEGGKDYYGRGYIQITHDYNYKKFGRELGMGNKLVNNPDLALKPNVAADILAEFFKENGVAKKAEKSFVAAREPINAGDKTYKIAKDAQKFLKTIKNS